MPKIEEPKPKRVKRHNMPFAVKAGAAVSSAQSNVIQQTSRFLDLPVEIRLRIYGFLVQSQPDRGWKEMGLPRTGWQPLLSVCRQISEEWIPFFYSASWIINDLSRKPLDLDTLYLKPLDSYKLRNIRNITHDASSEDHTRPAFSDIRTFASVLSKYKTALESLVEVDILALHVSMPVYTWSDNLASKPEQAARNLWNAISWSTEWDDQARSLQGRTRSGALRGWNLTKWIGVSFRRNEHGQRIYRPMAARLKFIKPDNLMDSVAEGPGVVVYKLDFVDLDAIEMLKGVLDNPAARKLSE